MSTGQLLQLRPAASSAGRPRVQALSGEALVAACATGDRAAQSWLIETHVDAVHRFIARMLGADAAAVDDLVQALVQATFLTAFRSHGRSLRPKLQSWLFGIAVNVMRTHVRKQRGQRRLVTTRSDPPATHGGATRDADAGELRAAIGALAPKLREVLVLVDLEGESGYEAARALGIHGGTLWQRLSEARAQLRDGEGARPPSPAGACLSAAGIARVATTGQLGDHAGHCLPCRRRLAVEHEVRQAAQGLPVPALSRVRRRELAAEILAIAQHAPPARPRGGRVTSAAVAVAMAAVIALIAWCRRAWPNRASAART
jgi:RNA polymerase sigma-70 factor, ECF subfamily